MDDPDVSHLGDEIGESMVHVLAHLAAVAMKEGVALLMDVVLDRTSANGAYARRHPDWYVEPRSPLDPRNPLHRGLAFARRDNGRVSAAMLDDWRQRLEQWVQAGVSGFRFK